jgi:hypothetical protein
MLSGEICLNHSTKTNNVQSHSCASSHSLGTFRDSSMIEALTPFTVLLLA